MKAKAIILAGIVAFVVVGLCLFFIMTPSFSKLGYMFQWKVYPGRRPKPGESFSGIWRQWDKNGVLVSALAYDNGKPHGKYYQYREDGSLEIFGQYATGEETGLWISFFSEGEVSEVSIQSGRMADFHAAWHQNGIIHILNIPRFEPNLILQTVWWDNGTIKMQGFVCAGGDKVGKWGDKVGKWCYWSSKGKLIDTQWFAFGQSVAANEYKARQNTEANYPSSEVIPVGMELIESIAPMRSYLAGVARWPTHKEMAVMGTPDLITEKGGWPTQKPMNEK